MAQLIHSPRDTVDQMNKQKQIKESEKEPNERKKRRNKKNQTKRNKSPMMECCAGGT